MKNLAQVFLAVAFCAVFAGCATQVRDERVGERPPSTSGCEPYKQKNDLLENNQNFRFLGGRCGGTFLIRVTFSGKEQFTNGDGSQTPYASIAVYGPNQTTANRCPKPYYDTKFNNFNLSCEYKGTVPPNGDQRFLVRYFTDNVSDQPLPKFSTYIEYVPTPQ
jgi:hypothetical protein